MFLSLTRFSPGLLRDHPPPPKTLMMNLTHEPAELQKHRCDLCNQSSVSSIYMPSYNRQSAQDHICGLRKEAKTVEIPVRWITFFLSLFVFRTTSTKNESRTLCAPSGSGWEEEIVWHIMYAFILLNINGNAGIGSMALHFRCIRKLNRERGNVTEEGTGLTTELIMTNKTIIICM